MKKISLLVFWFSSYALANPTYIKNSEACFRVYSNKIKKINSDNSQKSDKFLYSAYGAYITAAGYKLALSGYAPAAFFAIASAAFQAASKSSFNKYAEANNFINDDITEPRKRAILDPFLEDLKYASPYITESDVLRIIKDGENSGEFCPSYGVLRENGLVETIGEEEPFDLNQILAYVVEKLGVQVGYKKALTRRMWLELWPEDKDLYDLKHP